MARIQIPIDVLTSRLNLGDRFASMRSGSLSGRFSNLRPISEFLDVKRINKPADFGEMQSRVNYNLGHFSSNYAVVFSMLCIYGLLTKLWLLFDILLVSIGMYLIGKLDGRDFEFGDRRFSTVQLYTGLYVIVIPIALLSGVFGTMMWLIGASGVVIIGHASLLDKPIDEAFSGEARVEEVESDNDFDTQGVGASNALSHRFSSDPLRFTGVDLGDSGNTRSRRTYHNGDDETTDDSEQDSDDGHMRLPVLDQEEEALADAAMARIRRAQARGKTDVRLNKEELAAYQRRLDRVEAERMEAERRQRRERVVIPLAQLNPGSRLSRLSLEDDSPPRQVSPELEEERLPAHPPMGYFPPPSRTRPRSGTTSSRPPSRAAPEREQSSSPFAYSYINAPSASRHPSDPATGRPLSVAESISARNGSGVRTSYHAGAPSRNSAIDADDFDASYRSSTRTRTSRRPSDESYRESSNEDDGMLRVSSGTRSRPRERSSTRRPEPKSRDRTPPPSKKSSDVPSPGRRKVMATTRSGRKKK
ncbi:hypothetical protein N0V88_004864 [Collariella sp. IMI 366227]|nr:hypothetical protein N0V88_004864 [Collariella sp. IMI 366227]